MKIGDHVDVVAQPTVIRLEQLRAADSKWISDSYYITEEVERHFKALKVLLAKETGCGMFLIGHYGSGKSHFLAYLAQQLRVAAFADRRTFVLPLSLLDYEASRPLESILNEAVSVEPAQASRRATWKKIEQKHPEGLFIIIDELSEFLRSKSTPQSFSEDLRCLQFLGEWAQEHPLWILAALQEQIEHTGEMEYDLYRKIKDRYPIRFLLTPAHVTDLIAHRILRKKPSYQPAVEELAREWMLVLPDSSVDFARFCEIYPLHPATLELLEEVRDRFSQSRGIVDFTLTQLLGNEARGFSPFLDQPWGHVLTPDVIVDHFADLFEVQPEFQGIAQKVLSYYRKHIHSFFEKKPQQELAWRLLKLLVLVHISPRRKSMDEREASEWLFLNISKIDPAKNREVIQKVLKTLVQQGSYVKQHQSRYCLDLEDETKESLDLLLAKAVVELKNRGDSVFENLVPCLERSEFNPFTLPRDRWHVRRSRWCFHDRDVEIYFGAGMPPEPKGSLSLQIGLPWGPPAEGTQCYRIVPARLEITPDVLELAALFVLRERPLPVRTLDRVRDRIAARSAWFCSLVRAAYSDASVYDPMGTKLTTPLAHMEGGHAGWLNTYAEWMLRQTYPLFERFAPSHGPLPREAYRQFMKHAMDHDLGAADAPDAVKLIREAYLVPMGLMQRRGSEYVMNPKLENHDLVRLLTPIFEHHPTPARVYRNLSAPIHGLVPDQIHLLLLTLLIQGEIDIVKGEHSYRETFETLPDPRQYDKIVPGRALNLNQLRDLEKLCEGFHVPIPKQWSVLAQKRATAQLRKIGSRQRDQLGDFLIKLRAHGEAAELADQVERLITQWLALDKGENELQGLQHFLFAIGSPQRFIAEANESISMPARFERLLREAQRFRHLFGYPCLISCPEPDVATGLEALGEPPSIAQPEALESWLHRAQALYQKYQDWYRRQHEQWRQAANQHSLWAYAIPGVSRSRHLGLTNLLRQIEELRAQARAANCAGLGGLDFQPICRCGFDGKESPLTQLMAQFDEAANRLETELDLFFQQDRVKSKVQEWADQGLELNTKTLCFLEGKAAYPEIENLSLFDQHLSGLELVQPVKAEALLNFLGERPWEKPALMKALDQFFGRLGPRIVLHRETQTPRRELVVWCCEMALKLGRSLPLGFSSSEQAFMAEAIQPQWVSEESLKKLDQLGLSEEAIQRVLEMLLSGLMAKPRELIASGPVAAAMELLNPRQPDCTATLAQRIQCLYEQHERFLKLRTQAWLDLIDRLAQAELEVQPPMLSDLLQANLDAQWVIVDCLGTPLLDTVQHALPTCFPQWKLQRVDFGTVASQSSTDDFYRGLIEGKVQKTFEKINVIDDLIHAHGPGFPGLAKLGRAQLELACKRIVPKLDPSKPLLVFGDHGFRLAQDGSAFTHGGASMLERITLLFRLAPFSDPGHP